MEILINVIKDSVLIFLMALELAMLARALLSWFASDGNRIMDFLYVVTEPFVHPVRLLFEKLNWFQNQPLDMSFMVTYLIVSLLVTFLP